MARFQLGVRTSNVTSAQALFEIIAGNKGCRLRGINITLATAVTGVFGAGRPAAAGITPTTPVAFLSSDGSVGEPSLTKIALAWGTSPTAPASFYHRVSVPATVGAVAALVFTVQGKGAIWIPAGSTFTLHNVTGGPTLDATIEIEE